MSGRFLIERPGVLLAAVVAVSILPLDSVSIGQSVCAEGSLLEPYSGVCAPINDRREWWLTPTAPVSADEAIMVMGAPPEAGTINAGTTYLNGALSATHSSHLHTKMFVHPDGLNPSGFLDWVFTTATNRVDSAVEVVAIYRTALGETGVLSIFGRPCSLDYPCPDGDIANGWQPSKYFVELACNITHIVDDGGHSQKIVHYANHSDRLDDGDPPLWRNAVYLWNYCDENWDLIWQHEYRENKRDCSVEGCYFWGPGLELPGLTLRPEVSELGYEDSLLYHDGTWSELRSDETGFLRPEDRPDLSPWVLFHLDPNRSFGAGNFLDLNDSPEITGQQTLTTNEEQALELNAAMVTVEDPDVDPRFHAEFTLTVYGGDHYTLSDTTIDPDEDYFGEIQVPVSVSDGAAESATYTLLVSVVPVPDAPIFTSTAPDSVMEADLYTYVVRTHDPDDESARIESSSLPAWLTLVDHGDGTATLSGMPGGADVGDHAVTLRAIDSTKLTAEQSFTLTVVAAADEPVIEILGANPYSVTQGQAFVDPGATASDAQDGDLTAAIVTESNVNTGVPGTYEVTYSASDTAGHTATAARSVVVLRTPTSTSGGGGGGGSLDWLSMGVLLSISLMIATRRRTIPRRVGP
jgi:hypothetical protein